MAKGKKKHLTFSFPKRISGQLMLKCVTGRRCLWFEFFAGR